MFYFSTPLNVSFTHTKGDKRTLNCESLIIIIILLTYIRYICKLHSSSNKQKQRENILFFSQHKRPLSTPKQNCKMQFFLLSNTSMFTCSLFLSVHFSTLLISNENTYEHAHSYTHTQTRTQQSSSLSLSLRYETLTRRCQATATRAQVQMLG